MTTATELMHVPEPMLPMAVEQATQAMQAYQQLTSSLLTKDDWQGIPGRDQSFVKRRGWAKLATFYGVSTEVRSLVIDRDDEGVILRARAIARATHPNGRYAEGDGACSITERRFASAGGRQKIDHDLPATATTRAVNRAISNLIGFGAVSAEEVDTVTEVADVTQPYGPEAEEAHEMEAAQLIQRWHPSIDGFALIRLFRDTLGVDVLPEASYRMVKAIEWGLSDDSGRVSGAEGAQQPADDSESAPPDPSVSAYHQPQEPAP